MIETNKILNLTCNKYVYMPTSLFHDLPTCIYVKSVYKKNKPTEHNSLIQRFQEKYKT